MNDVQAELALHLSVFPRLAINLDKVLYAHAVGDMGHVEIMFENGQTLALIPEEAQASCFASLTTPCTSLGANQATISPESSIKPNNGRLDNSGILTDGE